MAQKDPYHILGVSRTATPEEIKRAYRKLAKEHHPDRNRDKPDAEQKFKEVQAAYEVVGDPQRRAQFDQFGAGGPRPDVNEWFRGGGRHPEGVRVEFDSMGDLSSIFEQFFNRGPSPARGRRRAAANGRAQSTEIEQHVELTFLEAARGTTRELLITDERGREQRIAVHIPAGVSDGQKIRAPNVAGGRAHVILHCSVAPHPYFRRDGLDLLLDVPMTFSEASLGGPVEIPTLDGSAVVSIPPGTSSGSKLRLRGKGLVDPRAGQPGDLYAVVKIVAPKQLSERARQLLVELDQELRQRPRANWPA